MTISQVNLHRNKSAQFAGAGSVTFTFTHDIILKAIGATITTSATVGSRAFHVQVKQPVVSDHLFISGITPTHGDSSTRDYAWLTGHRDLALSDNVVHNPIPELFVEAGLIINIFDANTVDVSGDSMLGGIWYEDLSI